MKKLIIAAMVAAMVAPALTSCDKDVRKCYHVTYETEVLGAKVELDTYMWCSANELEEEIEALKKTDGAIKITSKKVTNDYSTAEACTLANAGL